MMFHPEANHRSAFLNSSVNEGVFIKHGGVTFGVDDVRGWFCLPQSPILGRRHYGAGRMCDDANNDREEV